MYEKCQRCGIIFRAETVGEFCPICFKKEIKLKDEKILRAMENSIGEFNPFRISSSYASRYDQFLARSIHESPEEGEHKLDKLFKDISKSFPASAEKLLENLGLSHIIQAKQ